MAPSVRTSALVLAGGVALSLAAFAFGGSTAALCTSAGGSHGLLGVSLSDVRLLGIDVAAFRFEWYDGCNRRNSPLLSLVTGVVLVRSGTVGVVREGVSGDDS